MNREMASLGVIISAMVYGGVAVLTLTYIPLLFKTSYTISRRMRNFLLAYVVFMVATSTVNTVTLIIAFRVILQVDGASSYTGNEVVNLYTFPNGLAGELCVTFASWGADGFMVSVLKDPSTFGRGTPSFLSFLFVVVSYGDVQCCMREFRDLVDWRR